MKAAKDKVSMKIEFVLEHDFQLFEKIVSRYTDKEISIHEYYKEMERAYAEIRSRHKDLVFVRVKGK